MPVKTNIKTKSKIKKVKPRKVISDANNGVEVPTPTKSVKELSGIADTHPRHGGAHPQRGESKVAHGGVLNRKKSVDTCGMKYLKG